MIRLAVRTWTLAHRVGHTPVCALCAVRSLRALGHRVSVSTVGPRVTWRTSAEFDALELVENSEPCPCAVPGWITERRSA